VNGVSATIRCGVVCAVARAFERMSSATTSSATDALRRMFATLRIRTT